MTVRLRGFETGTAFEKCYFNAAELITHQKFGPEINYAMAGDINNKRPCRIMRNLEIGLASLQRDRSGPALQRNTQGGIGVEFD